MSTADAEGRDTWLAERPDPELPDAEELAWVEREARRERDAEMSRKYRLENRR